MVGIAEQLGVAALSGLIIGVIMTLMLYVTAPKMTPRFMKGADIDNRINRITSSLDAKVAGAVAAVDARVEKIFSDDVPKLLEEHVMTEDNLTGFGEIIRAGLHAELGQLNDGMSKVAESFKMAFIGNKGNEAKATKKDDLQAQKALYETAIKSHPQGGAALALAKQFDFDLPQMAAENPELAEQALGMVQNFMHKKGGQPGTGADIFG